MLRQEWSQIALLLFFFRYNAHRRRWNGFHGGYGCSITFVYLNRDVQHVYCICMIKTNNVYFLHIGIASTLTQIYSCEWQIFTANHFSFYGKHSWDLIVVLAPRFDYCRTEDVSELHSIIFIVMFSFSVYWILVDENYENNCEMVVMLLHK